MDAAAIAPGDEPKRETNELGDAKKDDDVESILDPRGFESPGAAALFNNDGCSFRKALGSPLRKITK